MVEPGRPLPGPEVPHRNPPGPGVVAGHRLGSGSADLLHSSDYSQTRGSKDSSPLLLRSSGGRDIKRFEVAGGCCTRMRYPRDGLTQGFRGCISLKGHLRLHPGRRHGSSSASGPGQRVVGAATVVSRTKLKGSLLGGLAQKRRRWRRAGLQEAEHTLHGVQDDHAGWPWGAWETERTREENDAMWKGTMTPSALALLRLISYPNQDPWLHGWEARAHE